MNGIYYVIPLLLIGIITPFSYAETLTSIPELEFADLGDSLEMSIPSSKVQLDKTSCSFRFYNSNDTLLFTDSIIGFSSIVNLYSWNEINLVNNAFCNAYYDPWEKTLVAQRHVENIGTMEYKYVYHLGVWKTQLEATNLTNLTDRVFGFDQTIDLNRDTINYGGSQRNLDNFDGQTFDRTWLENNEGKVIEFRNGYQFDFDLGFDNLDSVYVEDTGSDSSKLVFHYLRNNDVLLPGETLIIDPTVTQSSANDQAKLCSTCGKDPTGEKFTVTAALAGVYVREASVWMRTSVGSPTGNIIIGQFNSAGTLLHTFGTVDASTLTGSNVKYTGSNPNPDPIETGDIIGARYLGGDASNAIFVAEQNTDVYDSTNSYLHEGGTDLTARDLTFEIVYELDPPNLAPSPNAVDDLASPEQSFGQVSLLWSEPELNTGNVTGYQINYTTPYGNPLTTLTNNTNSDTTSAIISGLSINTPYTFGVSVWTEGGNNSTHPPMTWLNVTTQGNFTIGSATFNQTNTSVLPITFEEQSINSTAKFLNVTYSNDFVLNCDFEYRFANTNHTYYSLTGTAVSTTLNETSFIFNDFENEIIGVYCRDQLTGTDADYLLVQSDFPLLQQIASFRAGDYGTEGKIGVFDFITIAVIIFSMIGLNRVNESVGAIFNIALLGALAYFEIIELPTVIFGLLAVVLVFAITSTRKT